MSNVRVHLDPQIWLLLFFIIYIWSNSALIADACTCLHILHDLAPLTFKVLLRISDYSNGLPIYDFLIIKSINSDLEDISPYIMSGFRFDLSRSI